MHLKHLGASAALGLALLLGACGPQSAKITQPDLNVRATSAAKDRVVGQFPLVIRTYVTGTDGKKTEVTDANCRLQSSDLSVATMTPRRLYMPIYVQGARFKNRGAPAPVRVTCRGDGREGSTTLKPYPVGSTANSSNQTTSYSGGNSINVKTTSLTARMASAKPWTYGTAVSVVLK